MNRRWRLRAAGAAVAIAALAGVVLAPTAAFAADPTGGPAAASTVASISGYPLDPATAGPDPSTGSSGSTPPEPPTAESPTDVPPAAGQGSAPSTDQPVDGSGDDAPADSHSATPADDPSATSAPPAAAAAPDRGTAASPADPATTATTTTDAATAADPTAADATATAAATAAAATAAALAAPPAAPAPLPASTWTAPATPSAGEVLVQTDPAGIDFGVDISWQPRSTAASTSTAASIGIAASTSIATAPRNYQVELFSGTSTTNGNTLIARSEVDASTTQLRIEGVGFGRSTVTARVTAIDGAEKLPDPLISTSVTLPAASAGALTPNRAGTPELSEPTADGFTLTWAPAAADAENPAPAGYALRILERRHDQNSSTANAFIATTLDAGATTSAVVTGLAGSSRYLAAVVAYDLVDGVPRFRSSSAVSTAPAWSTEYAAETRGSRTPPAEWANRPAAPIATSARSLTWQGTPVTGRFTGGSTLTGYRVELHQSGTGLVRTTDVGAAASGPVATFTALTPGGRYSVRVATINDAGVGEFSDYGAAVTTPAGSTPGSRPPTWTDRAALEAAIAKGTVVDATPATPGGPSDPGAVPTAEQGADVTVTVPWPSADTGEAWWFGDGTFAGTVSTGGTLGGAPGASAPASASTTATLPTKGLAVGTHWLLFVTDTELDGAPTSANPPTALRVTITPSTAGILALENAVLRWGLNDESNNGAYFGGCNFLSAGRTPDPGGSRVFVESEFRAQSGSVAIEKPDASGRYVPATWDSKCRDRAGAPLSSGTATPYGGSQFVMTGGTGEVDQATGSASIRWQGDVTVAYYGGMTFWYLSDPVLTVTCGTGTLTATVGGFGTDMDDQSKWRPLAERTVTLASFGGVQVGADGFSATPAYRGVAVSLPGGQTPQSSSGADWGSFPQSFVDFHLETGQAAYWYSSGGQADAAKPAQPFVVGYDAATFTTPPAAETAADRPSAKTPSAKLPPVRKPAAAPPAAAALAAGSVATTASASSVVIVQSAPAGSGLNDTELALLIALVAALGLVIVVAAGGGALVVLGHTTPRR